MRFPRLPWSARLRAPGGPPVFQDPRDQEGDGSPQSTCEKCTEDEGAEKVKHYRIVGEHRCWKCRCRCRRDCCCCGFCGGWHCCFLWWQGGCNPQIADCGIASIVA